MVLRASICFQGKCASTRAPVGAGVRIATAAPRVARRPPRCQPRCRDAGGIPRRDPRRGPRRGRRPGRRRRRAILPRCAWRSSAICRRRHGAPATAKGRRRGESPRSSIAGRQESEWLGPPRLATYVPTCLLKQCENGRAHIERITKRRNTRSTPSKAP